MENGEAERKTRRKNRGLVVVLVFLVLAIVGLGGGILFVWLRDKDSDGIAERECFKNDNSTEILMCLDKAIEEKSQENLEGYLELLSNMSNVSDDEYKKVAEAVMRKAISLANNSDCLGASALVDEIKYAKVEGRELRDLYANALDIARTCGNIEMGEKYNELLIEDYSENGNGMGF